MSIYTRVCKKHIEFGDWLKTKTKGKFAVMFAGYTINSSELLGNCHWEQIIYNDGKSHYDFTITINQAFDTSYLTSVGILWHEWCHVTTRMLDNKGGHDSTFFKYWLMKPHYAILMIMCCPNVIYQLIKKDIKERIQ